MEGFSYFLTSCNTNILSVELQHIKYKVNSFLFFCKLSFMKNIKFPTVTETWSVYPLCDFLLIFVLYLPTFWCLFIFWRRLFMKLLMHCGWLMYIQQETLTLSLNHFDGLASSFVFVWYLDFFNQSIYEIAASINYWKRLKCHPS